MSVIYLGNVESNQARVIADEIDAGNITHAVFAFRTSDGDLRYRTVGSDHTTFLVGMLHRVAAAIHSDAGEEQRDEGD